MTANFPGEELIQMRQVADLSKKRTHTRRPTAHSYSYQPRIDEKPKDARRFLSMWWNYVANNEMPITWFRQQDFITIQPASNQMSRTYLAAESSRTQMYKWAASLCKLGSYRVRRHFTPRAVGCVVCWRKLLWLGHSWLVSLSSTTNSSTETLRPIKGTD